MSTQCKKYNVCLSDQISVLFVSSDHDSIYYWAYSLFINLSGLPKINTTSLTANQMCIRWSKLDQTSWCSE